jgi:hypothetical protein
VKSALLVAMLAIGFAAHADLYKCVGKDGKISYQSEECDQGAGSQRMRTPVSGPSGGAGGGSAVKDGWDDQKTSPMVSSCVRSEYTGAKHAYVAGGGNPSKLSEAELQQLLEAHCACMMRRIAAAVSYAEYSSNPAGPLQKAQAEAFNGGECKLDLAGLIH